MTRRARRQRLDSLHEIAEQLRQSAGDPAPDMTESILCRVHASREFLGRGTRRMLWVGRAAIGASVALVVLSVALVQRWSPESLEIVSRPAPLSTVVESVKSEAAGRFGELRLAVDQAVASSSSDANSGSAGGGGLLSLVSAASPLSTHATACSFCGPIMPPGAAARAMPSPAPVPPRSPRVALASYKLASSESEPGTGLAPGESGRWSVRSRFGTAAALLGPEALGASVAAADGHAACRPVLRTLSLNELAPLGAAGAADSALAPK